MDWVSKAANQPELRDERIWLFVRVDHPPQASTQQPAKTIDCGRQGEGSEWQVVKC